MVRTRLTFRLLLSTLALTIGLAGLSTAANGQDDQSGDISITIERRLAAPGATTDLGLLRCPAATAEIWWWQYWSDDDNAFFRFDASEWPLAFADFARGRSTPLGITLPESASLGPFALAIICVDAAENTLGRADVALTSVGQFRDVEADDFYATAVLFARANGITIGTSVSDFSPDEPVTRWQMALFLRRLADLTAFAEAPWTQRDDFEDTIGLASDRRTAIGWLAHTGITKGTTATEYDPAAPVTRWQMALFLRRFAEYFGTDVTSGLARFSDTGGMAPYQREAIGWLAENGITTGIGDNLFDPAGVVTRGQMVTFLMRLVEYITVQRLGR